MRIFLIGYMGCGKTTFGRKFAAKIGYDFVDLDDQFEVAAGATIANYFTEHGEAAFRIKEQEVLKTYAYPVNCIVATGGGVPCFFDNMEWMNSNGTTVYIEMSPATLAQRLEKGRDKRPLLRDLSDAEVVAFIKEKLAEREKFYKRASLTVSGISLTADQLKEQLFQIS